MKVDFSQNKLLLNGQSKSVAFCGSAKNQPSVDTFEKQDKKKITAEDVENSIKRGYYLANKAIELLNPYMQTLSETVIPATPLGGIISSAYKFLLISAAWHNHLINKSLNKIDNTVAETKSICKKEFSKEDFELAQKRELFKLDYKKDYYKQFDKDDILALVKLDEKQFAKAKNLFWIDGRKNYEQFNGEEIAELVQLPDNLFKKAESLFFKKNKKYDALLNAWRILDYLKYDKNIEEAKEYNPLIKTEIENMLSDEYVDLEGIVTLSKAVNELNGGEYSKENNCSGYTSILENFRKNKEGSCIYEAVEDDRKMEEKYGSVKVFVKNHPNSPVSKYFYGIYLKDLKSKNTLNKEIINKCREFYAKYNTQIYPSICWGDTYDLPEVIDYIDKEFQKWEKAGADKVKYPPIIDFNKADYKWYIKGGVYGNSLTGTAAYVEDGNNCLHFKAQRLNLIQQDLRHEMTHINDTKNGVVDYTYEELAKIMPKGRPMQGKYYDEFNKAGITYTIVEYAHNNPMEYIAVASEGDMSKYSDEFKKVLVKLGMPEWEFSLEK